MAEQLLEKYIQSNGTIPVSNEYNKNDCLPMSYQNPASGAFQVKWVCNLDDSNRITSVLLHCDENGKPEEPTVSYLESHQDALNIRADLIAGGWKKFDPNDMIEFSVRNADGSVTKLNRHQLRELKKLRSK